jgi:hypothetical protein
MLGQWMLQNGGDFPTAVQHLQAAAATGQASPFVRELQIAGLTDNDDQKGARAELMRIASAMRAGSENLDSDDKRQIFNACCNITINRHAELAESLSAVPAQDAWLTYLWLEDSGGETLTNPLRPLIHVFIQANLLEISGQRRRRWSSTGTFSRSCARTRALRSRTRSPAPWRD